MPAGKPIYPGLRWGGVKYKYCPECRKAYVKSRLEGDRCIYCNADCDEIDVRRNGTYYLGYGLTVAGAACVAVPRLTETENGTALVILGLATAVVGMVLVVTASFRMAKNAAEAALDQEEEK